MAGLVGAFDWSRTSLGAIAGWPQSLKTAADLMLASAQPVHIAWGPELVSLYNDAHIPIAGERHPGVLGQPYRMMWPDNWDEVRPVVDAVMGGTSREVVDQPVAIAGRSDRPIRWFSFSWTPLRDESGAVAGFYGAAVETTDRVLADRTREWIDRTLFDTIDEGVCLCERVPGQPVDFRYLTANAAFERQSGLGDPVGRTIRELVPDVEDAIMARYAAVAETGRPDSFTSHVATLDRWFEIEALPAGRRGQIAVLFRDVTSRKQAEQALRESEERQAFLLALSDVLRPLGDPIAIQAAAMRVLGVAMEVNRAFYGDAEDDHDTLLIGPGYSHGTFPLEGQVRFSEFELDMAAWYRAGRTYVIEDARRDTRFGADTKAGFAAIEVGAAVGVPLVEDGRVRAIVSLHQSEPRRWTEAEITLAEAVAERTWAAVERARAEAALRASEEKYRTLFEKLGQGYAECELIRGADGRATDLRYIALNPALERLSGLRVAETVGRTAREAIPGVEDWQFEMYGRIVDAGVPERIEYETGPLGRWYEVYVYPSAGDRFFTLYEDITERKQAETALRDSEARYHALFAASPVPFMVLAANPPDFTITAANDAYFAATLTTRETLIGRRLFDVFTDDPRRPGQLGSEALDVSLERVLRTRRTDAMERVRYDIVTPDGGFEAHWWLAINAPLLDAAGNVTAIIHQVDRQTELHYAEEALRENETALRESQERQAFLLRLSDALRADPDPIRIQEEATRLLGRTLGVDRAVYAEFLEEGGQEFVVIEREYRTAGTPSFEGRHTIAQFGSDGPDLKAGRVIVVDDTEREAAPDEQRAVWRALGVRARMGVPLIKGGRPVVGLGVHSSEPRAWSPDDVALVRDVGERTWEAVQRARAEAALRDSETRLRQFGEASQDVLWIRDAETLQWTYLTPAFEAIYGLGRTEALAGNNYQSWLDLIVPEDRERATNGIRRVRAGENVTFDYRIRRPSDGAIRWLRNTDFPITDETGAVTLVGGIGHDLTELREAELRLQTLIEGIPQLVWRAVDGGTWTWASPQWTSFTGLSEADSLGRGWLNALHPDDRHAAREAWAHAGEAGGYKAECRLSNAAAQEYRWFQTGATPVRDEAGEIIEWLGTSTDIHEMRTLQERQQVLVAELQHRTRNLMGVVRSTANKTAEASSDLADFQDRFNDRLRALARVQGLLSRLNETDRIAFDELIRSELAAMDGVSERVTLDGPGGIRLRSSMVQTLAMAVHELATNAVKYGALGQPHAQLTIRWRMEAAPDRRGRPRLHIDWRESGVAMPPVGSAPQGGGQGRELIEQALPYQLDAETSFDLGPDGIRCTITIPVSASNAVEPAHA